MVENYKAVSPEKISHEVDGDVYIAPFKMLFTLIVRIIPRNIDRSFRQLPWIL